MKGELISSAADFPHVQVHARPGAGGPVLTLSFRNPEYSSGMYGAALLLALPGWPLILLLLLPVLIPAARQAGLHWAVPVAGLLAVLGLLVVWLMPPNWRRREIVIDDGRDLLIAHNGSGRVERPFSALRNLTVEPHPRAELERQRKGGRLGPFQKQHCLFGWFGAGGADKVQLVTRYEYPPQNSLFEVRQALLWAAGRTGRRKAGQGINPPLD